MRLVCLTLLVALSALAYTGCSDDDYGKTHGDASAASDLGTKD